MPLPDFDGQTWVAFSDLCGTKAIYAEDPDKAAKVLDIFYNTVYDIQCNSGNISSLVVSDCAIFWIHGNGSLNGETKINPDMLGTLLEQLQKLHQEMIRQNCLIRSTVAYGHFKYQQRLEMPRIRKNMVIGGGYLEAYVANEKQRLGSIVIVKKPDDWNISSCRNYESYISPSSENGAWEYIWWSKEGEDINGALQRRDKAIKDQYTNIINGYKRQTRRKSSTRDN